MKISFPWLTRCLVVLLTSLLLSACASTGPKGGQVPGQNHGFTAANASAKEWWNIAYPSAFDAASLSEQQSFIKVEGNRFVTEEGNTFIFRGVSISDPGKLGMQKRWNKALFEEVHRWGANTVRLPIHPLSWRMHGSEWYFARIDEAVRWANALDMYLIIDWHSMGNLETEMYQHVMYETTQKETADFWRKIALRYNSVPTVAVYEIFNEPTHDYMGTGPNSLGRSTWESWRNMLESYIDLIYAYNKKAIPLVAGHNWAYDLSQVGHAPVRRQGVAYAIHPYPQKARPANPSRESFFAMWDKTWGYVADKYPLIASELGWSKETDYGSHVPTINNDGTYGPNIVEYMRNKGISYTAWVFDPEWYPAMIYDWKFRPTEQGEFFKQEMLKERALEQGQ